MMVLLPNGYQGRLCVSDSAMQCQQTRQKSPCEWRLHRRFGHALAGAFLYFRFHFLKALGYRLMFHDARS